MKMRIWHNCLIVAELELPDGDTTSQAGQVVWFPDDSPIVGYDDHISVDPWNKLAGDHVGREHQSVSIALPGVSHGTASGRATA